MLALAAAPKGFLAAAVAAKVREIRGPAAAAYTPRHAAYDLKKPRGKHWVRATGKSRSYEVVRAGSQAMTVILVLRDKVIKPLLTAAAKPTQTDPRSDLCRWTPCIAPCKATCASCSVSLFEQHDRPFF